MGMKHPSLAGMVAAIEACISRVALHQRFTASASTFLKKCLLFVLKQRLRHTAPVQTKLLRNFRHVFIVDSSSWSIDEKLRNVLLGSGGSASSANCKLQAAYEYKKGKLAFLDVTSGILPDNRYTDHLPWISHPICGQHRSRTHFSPTAGGQNVFRSPRFFIITVRQGIRKTLSYMNCYLAFQSCEERSGSPCLA